MAKARKDGAHGAGRWWSFHVAASANGPRLVCWRKGQRGPWSFDEEELSVAARVFLSLRTDNVLGKFSSMTELADFLRKRKTDQERGHDIGIVRAVLINKRGAIGRVVFACRVNDLELVA